MKIVVIGGTGLIGSKVVDRLRKKGHQVLAAAPSSGVNTLTGEGLDEALRETDVVVDLANSPSFEDQAVMDFFQASGRNLAAAEKRRGVKHHLILSIVGSDRLAASGYMRAKVAQETLARASGIPYTIVHSTQFFEFLNRIAKEGADEGETRLSTGLIQPIASEDVADAVADHALGAPVNGVVEIAGPDKFPLADLVQRFLAMVGDTRKVVADPTAPYFGAVLEADSLVPREGARLGRLDFQAWFEQSEFSRRGAAA
ncbi:SDR family oxidoreductase [Frateuria hangzhouensis]|uniref:SDR family oxidoreductase n=1 Tax=Frateuria hangzhouensis TaxID=2995589 RepID=UPI002260BEBD|nr:SDR family oxidoreductase [Frateuria sp. STR12]MCX7512256.1 SDR family oxidoreductase [Frateuria sp. STR12]